MWSFLKSQQFFLLEIYLLVRLTSLSISMLTISLLVQDKLCVNSYNQSAQFCQKINQAGLGADHVKDNIFSDTAMFTNYKNLIQSLPMFVWSLFVGSFLDKYQGGTKLLLVIGNVCDIIDLIFYIANVHFFSLSPYYMLISSSFIWFTGGMISFLTAIYRYIVINTTLEFRSIKFVIFQFCLIIALSLGTLIGGHLLVLKQNSKQLRNYNLNFLLSLVMNVISVTLIFFLKNNDLPVKKLEITDEDNLVVEQNNNSVRSMTYADNEAYSINQDNEDRFRSRSQTLTSTLERTDEQKPYSVVVSAAKNTKNVFQTMFDVDNVRQTFTSVFKHRPNNGRTQIWLLYTVIFLYVIVVFGVEGIFLQFCEKVYHWNAASYSNVSAISKLTSTILLSIASYVLVKRIKMKEGTLIIISLPSGFLGQLIIGTFLDPIFYYISVPIGSLFGLTAIAARTKLSTIVPEEEIGKIFSLISTLESVVPFIGSFLFSSIFIATVSILPGLVYQASAAMILLALVVTIYEEIYCG